MSKALFTDRSPRRQISLWNAVAIYFACRRFMIAINILINDLLNYNCDRYLPTQLQGGVACNLWCHLSMLHTLLLTVWANSRCVPWYCRCSHSMWFLVSSFNFRRPDISMIKTACSHVCDMIALFRIKQILPALQRLIEMLLPFRSITPITNMMSFTYTSRMICHLSSLKLDIINALCSGLI